MWCFGCLLGCVVFVVLVVCFDVCGVIVVCGGWVSVEGRCGF